MKPTLLFGLLLAAPTALAQFPGVTPTEIKIGQTTSYSGPASQYGQIGKVQEAFFRKLNEEGGINGRKITFLSLDDGYSPPKSVEQARKLVESDGVALMMNSFGGPTNAAQAKYLNGKGVPQLFVGTGAHYWSDFRTYPWSMGWQPSFRTEARVFTKDALAKKPDAKVAILYQNDDFGKDYLSGLRSIVERQKAASLIAEISYDATAPTIDSQVVKLQSLAPDVVILAAIPKFAAQFIRKTIELDWNPAVYVTGGASGVATTTEAAKGLTGRNLYTAAFFKDWTNPDWKNDAEVKPFLAFMEKYAPSLRADDFTAVYGYSVAQTMVQVLTQAGADLSRENIMKQAAAIVDLQLPLLTTGIAITTGPGDHLPIETLQLAKWNGQGWAPEGGILSAD